MHHADTRSTIKRATDIPGPNLRVVRGTSYIFQCRDECVATDGCNVIVHDVHNGDCFMKAMDLSSLGDTYTRVSNKNFDSWEFPCTQSATLSFFTSGSHSLRCPSGTVHRLHLQDLACAVGVSCQVQKVWCVAIPKS